MVQDFFSRLGTVGELFRFFWRRKLYWLLPMLTVLVLVMLLMAIASAGGVTPFVYSIF